MSTTTDRPVFGEQAGVVDTPAWVRDAVFYQIFPDRFAKSERLVKPGGIEDWDSDPTTYGYKGGDLYGVIEHLDYIQSLGCTALYFNPIFQSASNHRYHTHDYMRIDPLLGGDVAFDELMAECKKRDIRVILDGVFNHSSRGFFQFNDILENGEKSAWLDWFTIHGHPANAYDHGKPAGYLAWWGLHALPKFNTDNPQVREYIMQVGEYWLGKGIDGWRLDVPDEITTPGFWEEFRERMRAINPECYIVGEIWEISTEYLGGERFDALMNYVFTGAALAFAGRDHVVKELQDDRAYNPWPGIDGLAYADKIDSLLASYDWNIQTVQMNLLDSHDTARAISLLGGDQRSLELAALLQFTFPGPPSVYYGSEVGVDGGLPDCWARKSFPWGHEDRWNTSLLHMYRSLIAIRAENPALRTGSYQCLFTSASSYVFARELDGKRIVVAVNTSEVTDELPTDLFGDGTELYGIGNGISGMSLAGRSACIWAESR